MQWQKIALVIFLAQQAHGATLHFQTGELSRPMNFSDYLTDGQYHFRLGKAHYLLAFPEPVGQDTLDLLTKAGAKVTAFVPDNAVMVVAPDNFDPSSANAEFVTRLRPEQKRSNETTLTSVVEFHADVDPADARDLLELSGLTILYHPDLLANHFLVLGDTEGLENWDEVDYIFPASEDLVNGVHVYACEPVVAGKAATPMYVTAGHGWTGDGLNGVTLQYTFSSLTTKVASALVVQELTRALNQWPKYANVHFVPGLNPQAAQTVAIKFATYDHGDGFPFDGPGGLLGHTFYPVPTNPEPIAGDMHLDGSEDWNVGADTDIYTVALHEAGHALGLGHTSTIGAIMYPYYHLGAQISSDDIAGIQALYGPANGSQPTTPSGPGSGTSTPAISLAIQSPVGSNIQTTAATEQVMGTVSNAAGVPTVSWQTDHGQAGVASGTTAWTIAAAPLTVGSNTITVTATDLNHQMATQSVQVTRNTVATAPTPPPVPTGPDTLPPVISIRTPASTIMQTNQSTVTVSGTAADNVGVASVTWQNTLMGSGTASGTTAWTASAIPVYPGTNTLILRAFDAAGNSSWRSITVVRY